MILSAMVGMYANSHVTEKTTPANNTTKNNSSITTTNGTDEGQTTNTETHTETHTETSNAKQNNNNKNNHEDTNVKTTSMEDDGGGSEDYGDANEIYIDERGRASIGYWDDEGYWNAVYTV